MEQTPVVLGRVKPVLQEKGKADKCNRCKSEFGFFSIKYHCMACGFIFCKTCADVCILLPDNFDYDIPQRVCDDCLKKYSNLDYTKHFDIAGPTKAETTVVLISGAMTTRMGCWPSFKELSKHYRVISVELPGLGSRRGEKLTRESALRTVVDVIEKHVPEKKAFVYGHSMGAYVTMALCKEYPHLVRGAIMGAALNEWTPIKLKMMSNTANVIYKLTPRAYEYRYTWNYSKEAFPIMKDAIFRSHMDMDMWLDCTALMMDPTPEYSSECLGVPTIPKLMISGDKDMRFSQEKFQAALKGDHSKIVVIKGAGHVCQFEKFDEFHREVINFINAVVEDEDNI